SPAFELREDRVVWSGLDDTTEPCSLVVLPATHAWSVSPGSSPPRRRRASALEPACATFPSDRVPRRAVGGARCRGPRLGCLAHRRPKLPEAWRSRIELGSGSGVAPEALRVAFDRPDGLRGPEGDADGSVAAHGLDQRAPVIRRQVVVERG